ncbi:hypothetical protein C8J57DRAFT_1520206 [Mycena rebaudengoi]|nr:hypothetical protein C8J57DRAFT_1520206 [Mycena rebaudengoi]
MQTTFVSILAVLTAGVCAAPLNAPFDRTTCDIKSSSCECALLSLTEYISACVIALQPPVRTACDPAVRQLGANTPLNTACLVAAAKATAAFPIACAPCAAQFGVIDPGNKSQTPACGATGSAAAPNGGHGTIATPAAHETGQAVGPRATCDIKACVINLEPTFPLCAPAVTQLGADNSFNAVCLGEAAKGTTPFPSVCDGCATQFGVADPGAGAQAAGVAIN